MNIEQPKYSVNLMTTHFLSN